MTSRTEMFREKNVENESVLKMQYTYVYLMGDYDRKNLPGPNDLIDTVDTIGEAQRELEMVARENSLPENHYIVVSRQVTPWEVVG